MTSARDPRGDPGTRRVVEIRWLTAFLDWPEADAARAEPFWLTVTDTTLSPRRGPAGEFATLLPKTGDAYLRVQKVRDGGGCHLDLHVRDLGEAAATAVSLGATERSREDGDVIVLESPGGFPFCFVGWDGENEVPRPVHLKSDAGASRLDQLCLDAPPRLLAAEFAFWQALTGWEPRESSVPGFGSLDRPQGIPVRLLFQRLGDDEGARVTGHADFACEDRDHLAALHTTAGAKEVARFPHWTVMEDPTGRRYCLTARSPYPDEGR